MAKAQNSIEPEVTEPPVTAPVIPQWQRNEKGLLDGVEYVYNADGSINWRKMVKPEFLLVNRQNFEKRKEEVPESIEGLDDKDLLISLAGIKDLAKLRGYSYVKHNLSVFSPNYCAVTTRIGWTPNFETGEAVVFEALADASKENTQGFARLYLAAIAENRGFVRAVRNFLGISIAGQDELGPLTEGDEEPSASKGSPNKFLTGLLKKNNIKFESFKNRMIEKSVEGADTWESLESVPSEKIPEVTHIVQQILDAKKKQ